MTDDARYSPRRVICIPLGETEGAAKWLLRHRFPGARIEWLNRTALWRRLLALPFRSRMRQFDEAVLFAPDLRQPRLRLTALLAALPRARRRWLADRRGAAEPFTLGGHLRDNALPIARHLSACGLALAMARPLLWLADAFLAFENRRGRRPVDWQQPQRLLYLRSQFWFGLRGGGSVGHTAGVIGGLQEAGVAVHVVSSDHLHGVSAPTQVVRPEQWCDGRLREVEELAFNGAFFAAALRVAREFRSGAVYQRYTAFNFGGALLSRLLRIPLVLEFNSSDLWKGRHWGEFHMLGLAEIGERVNLRAADRVVAVSHVLRDELVARGVPAEKVIVNPNAADPRQFRPDVPADEVRLAHGLVGRTVVGFSGTFGVWHGIPTLAAALPIVAAERPEVAFLLVGDGPLHHLVDEAVTRHGLHGRVALSGLVPHKQMPAYLAACDVLVSPHGRQADGRPFFGSPTKLYEYMASGRAIVASQVGQIGEVLRHGETALLVPPEDPEALAGAILNLVDDQALRARLGAAARAQAVREHTWLQNARGVLSSLDRESIQRTRSGDHPVPGAVIARNLANEARRGRDQRRADMDFLPRTHSQS